MRNKGRNKMKNRGTECRGYGLLYYGGNGKRAGGGTGKLKEKTKEKGGTAIYQEEREESRGRAGSMKQKKRQLLVKVVELKKSKNEGR